jgi:hypothetical protein
MRRLVLVCLLVLPLMLSCVTDMKPSQLGNPAASRRVFISAQDTGFKQKVLSAVVDKLGQDDWYFKITGLSDLTKVDIAPYVTVLIMAPIEGGVIDKRVGSFLASHATDPKVLVLLTYGMKSLKDKIKWNYMVDTVSSASRTDLVGTQTKQLVALIKNKQ